MMAITDSPPRPPRVSRRRLAWAAGLLALLGLAVFLALPPIARSVLENRLAEALHRQVTVGEVKFNPFTLKAEVAGLSVRNAEEGELLGLDALQADLEIDSLFQGGLVLRELRLDGPRLQVTRLSPGRYDISDLLDEWSQPSEGGEPLGFAVGNIQVSGGKAVFVDKPKGRTHTVTDLALGLPFISNLPSQTEVFVEPHFSASINGAPLVLTGRSKPFSESHESELSLDLDKLKLADYLPYSPVTLPFEVRGGSLDTELKLVFRQQPGKPASLKLAGKIRLADLALAEKGGAPLLAWKQLDVGLGEADPLQGRYLVESLRLAGLAGHVRMNAQGRLNWQELADALVPPPVPPKPGAKPAKVAWEVKEVRLEKASLRFQDQRLPGSPVQALDEVEATVGGLSSAADARLAVDLAARVNGGGSFKAGGEVATSPLAAKLDLEVESLPLLPLQPYFAGDLNLTVTRGQLSGKGSLDLLAKEEGFDGGFKGQMTLGDLQSVDKANKTDFLKWKSLFLGDIDAKLQPFSLAIGEVALSDFYARLIVTPQGKLNLLQIRGQPQAESVAATPTPAPAADGKARVAAVPPAPEREVLPVRIGKVSLQGGTINFSDFFVRPNYTVNMTRIGGRITGLSSAPNTVADLELRGNYGNSAPVEVVAKLNPLAAKTYLDLRGEIRGVNLTTLSAYSGKYAGYAIDKGKLSLFVTYKLENNQLLAENRVFLDQLTFGDKVDSPDATSLPVKLAIALLKNGRGEIDVNLPISGSIDDPEFSLGGVVLRVIGNLLVKAVTAPFSFLGALFGGGAELSNLEFAVGRADLSPEAVKRLEALAKAMLERPALKLEITGRAHPDTDREGLKRVAVERAVQNEKLKEMAKKGGGQTPPEAVEISPGEYPALLQRAYREAKFPKPRNIIGLTKDLPVEEMEKLMLANLPVGEEDLQQLAARRAEAAQAWLLEQGKVPPERLFLLAPKVGAENRDDVKAGPNRVDFSLR